MPLRFPRPVVPVIAIGMAAIWVAAATVPAGADEVRQQEWWIGKLHVGQAWKLSRGGGVTVAILSDGVDATQADVDGSVTVGPDYTNSNETTSTYVGLQGTAIASLIAGHGHGAGDASGIIGIAPRARILSVRVTLDVTDPALDSATTGVGLPDAIAAGIQYAVAHGAKVIDLPLDPGEPNPAQLAAIPLPYGTTTPPQTAGITAAAGGSPAEQAAIAYALKKRVVLVAPAGDDGAGANAPNYPAAYPGVISVGAFGANFVKAPYSVRQPYVTLTAAGENVMAADSDGGYATVSSTNAASAVVTGIVALIRSRFPQLSVAQIRHVLTSSTVFRPTGGRQDGSGYGTVDAGRALAAAAALAAPARERAGFGALARSQPAAPAVLTVTSNALVPRVLRAAIIAAAVLILLLALIGAYAAAGRRRERQRAAATADWGRSAPSTYSPHGASDADRMLEFFAAPTGDPTAAAGPFPQFQVTATPTSGFPVGQASARPAPPPPARPAAEPATAAPAGPATGEHPQVGGWVPLGPASRAQSRPPRVSGAPPWEPAPEPDSELPWAAVPEPSRTSRRPSVPAPDLGAESAWPRAANPASAPPDGQAWENLTASARAVRAMPEDGLPPPPRPSAPPAAPSSPSPAPAASAAPSPAPAPPLAKRTAPPPASRHAAASPTSPAAATPSGSLWEAASWPRSPSGTDWETAGSESGPDPTSDDEQALGWRSGAQTETFPAIGEDS